MATISSLGIGSGLDVNSIVTQLVALERRPIEQLQTAKSGLNSQLSAFGRIQGALDSLRSAARTLTNTSTWAATTATSSDTAALGASSSSTATPGAYAVNVAWLAATQLNATSALPSASEVVGEGTLHIQLGTWADDLSGFTPKDGAAQVDITIGPGESTLAGIRDKINATAGAGVRASIVNDASGARLVLQSTETGAANGFRILTTDADGVGDDDAGVSRLAYDPESGTVVSTRSQPARNASLTVNGLPVESASNTLSNVVDGLTLKLLKPTAGAVDVAVSRDSESMKKSVQAFVSAYNDVVNLLREQTKFVEASKTAGPLQGDRAAISIMSQLRSALGVESSASATFARASDIGIDVQKDGTIKLGGSKLDDALANVTELQKFFATSTETATTNGLGDRMRRLLDGLLSTEGTVASRQDGLRKRISNNDARQAQLEDRVAAVEKRLRAQYQALDLNMSRLTGLQGYVAQQITNWNRSSG